MKNLSFNPSDCTEISKAHKSPGIDGLFAETLKVKFNVLVEKLNLSFA